MKRASALQLSVRLRTQGVTLGWYEGHFGVERGKSLSLCRFVSVVGLRSFLRPLDVLNISAGQGVWHRRHARFEIRSLFFFSKYFH